MKEEGEITDDDDDKQVAATTEVVVPKKAELRRRVFNRKRKRAASPDRHSVSIRSDTQRSYDSQKSLDRALGNTRNTAIPALMDIPVSAIRNTKPDFKICPDLSTSVPHLTSSFRPCLLPPPLPSQLRSQAEISIIGTGSEFKERGYHGSVSQKTQISSTCKVSDGSDTEVITIDDSDADVSDDIEVLDGELKQDDEDLDELQLRRDALDSAVKSNKSQIKICASFDRDSGHLLDSASVSSGQINLRSTSSMQNLLPGLDNANNSVQFGVENNLCASDSTCVSGVIPVTAGSGYWNHDQLVCGSSHLLEDNTKLCQAVLSQESNNTSFVSLLNAEVPAVTVTASTYHNIPVNSTAIRNSGLPVCQDTKQSDIDNYDEVEMDLDSGSDSETHAISSCEHTVQTSNIPDQSFPQNECEIKAPLSLESLATSVYSGPPPKLLCNWSDNVVNQLSATHGSSNAALNQDSAGTVVYSAYDDKIPVALHAKTGTADYCNVDNVQQQRKVKDADKKSELLLRAAVLQSLSSKRQQQQQQSQLVTGLCVPPDRVKGTKLQVPTHCTKRTITSTTGTGSQLTVQLPVHQPVVISLNGESSDSDDAQQLDMADSCDRTGTAMSNSLVGMSSSLDRVLREIRRATEGPKSQDCDIASSHQVETASAVEYQEKATISEPALANQSNNSQSSLPHLTHNKRLLVKNAGVSSSKGTGDSTLLDTKDNSLQRSAVCNLQTEISAEKRNLQQQKIALSKTKLKMARKKEQVETAEKRTRKLREQLAAAEKIAISSKKQLDNVRQETLSLTHGIEQHQKAISRLEVQLRIAQKNLVSSANESGSDVENFRPLCTNPQSSDVKVSRTLNGNTGGDCTAIDHQESVRCSITADVPVGNLSTSRTSQSSLDTKLYNAQCTQLRDSALMTLRAKLSDRLKRSRHLNAVGACQSESGVALVKDKFGKTELTSDAKCNEVESSQTTKQQTVSHTVNSAYTYASAEQPVSQALALDVCTAIKPCISVPKSNMPTVQKADGTSSDDLAVVSGKIGISSALLDEFTMPSDKKMKQILHHYRASLDRNSSVCSLAPPCQLFVSDPMFSFQFPVNATSTVTANFLATASKSDALELGDYYKPYCSSLLCFRSYRFSDFCQQQGLSVSSETFSHKIDCRVPLCKYDLMGKCLDEFCPWQHRSDYTLSNREHLLDVVSFCPSVAGVDTSTPASRYKQLLNQYIDSYLKDTSAQLSHSEQCLGLIDRVKRAAGLAYPSAVCTSRRCWKLQCSKQCFGASDGEQFLFNVDDISERSAHESITTDDVRYWMVAESDQIKDLEEAVTDTPNDDAVWIKLAYAKMMEMKWSASHDEYISHGLNVLTHALEANPSNSRLWTHYLDLYVLRSHAETDISLLYEQAIQYAPSYEFFWKYLQLPVNYSQKMDICKRLRQYLCSPMCRDDADTRSHHLLETVLYQAALCTTSGRFKDGLQVMQAIVQSKASVIWLGLTSCDRIVIWLSFIHLYECKQLPKTLFDPANSNPGPVVQKEAFVVPFQSATKTRISYSTLLQLFNCAFGACDKEMKPGSESDDAVYAQWLAALYRSRILLELACCGQPAARQLCEQLLQQRPYLVDVWLFLVQLTAADTDHTTQDKMLSASILSTVEKSLASNPHSVALFLAGVCALIECGETDGALGLAERCPISLFEVDQLDSTSVDPNLLYCCVLGQPVPPSYTAPPLRSSVPRRYVADQQANLWLSYCLLLDLQGAHAQATETYHLALSCLTSTKDIQRLWLAFLRRTTAVIFRRLPWLSAADSYHQKRLLWQQFESDIDQALTSVPVRRSLPHSRQTWDDYSFRNEIIQLRMSCLTDTDLVQDAYQKYMHQMPENVELALTAINRLLKGDAVPLSRGLCLLALHSCPRSALLWNIYLRLSQRSTTVGLMRSLYAKATKMLPFSADLWKTFIMFEVVNRSRGHLREVLEKCRHLQVNITAGFVESLLK